MRTRELAASTEPANLIFADVPRRSIAEQKRARKHKKSSIPEETAEYVMLKMHIIIIFTVSYN